MIDIFDRLLCSLGEDIVYSLYCTLRFSSDKPGRILFRFIFTFFYVILHSVFYFIHIITLNVVINSIGNALLTILISNNFLELKVVCLSDTLNKICFK